MKVRLSKVVEREIEGRFSASVIDWLDEVVFHGDCINGNSCMNE